MAAKPVDCYCPCCLAELQAALPVACSTCRKPLLPKYNPAGDLDPAYRAAFCCGAGCKQCPYEDERIQNAA